MVFKPVIEEEKGVRYFKPFIQKKILYPEPFYSGNVRCVCNLLFNRKYYSTEHFVQEMYVVFVTFCSKENTTVLLLRPAKFNFVMAITCTTNHQ